MELLLDTANLEEIKEGLKRYPLTGITTNPTIMKKEGAVNFFAHLKKIKSLITEDRDLHVQVTALDTEGMIADARRIVKELGPDTYIKIPVTKAGLEAMKILSEEDFRLTATAVYTTMQGILALMAGASYIAVYYNRMQNQNIDPEEVISDIEELIENETYDCEILCASFRNLSQVVAAFGSGASCATVSYDLLETALSFPSIERAVNDFYSDWQAIHPGKSISNV